MPSPLDIANQALLSIGTQSQISSFSPSDSSTEADAISQLFEPLKTMLFRSANWGCLRAQVTLTQLKSAIVNGAPSSDPPPSPWGFEYAWPSDCLRARFILPLWKAPAVTPPFTTGPNNITTSWGLPGAIPYQIASDTVASQLQKVILTNLPQAQLVYTRNIADPDLWDPSLIQAMVATLGAALVNPLARNAQLFKDMTAVAAGIVNQARVSDGDEGTQTQDHLPDWMQVRGVYADGGSGVGPYYGWWSSFICGTFVC